jgi:transcriptional regulator with XRE-family HTH domain
MSIIDIVAKNIRKFRIKKGYSQEELGEMTDLHRTYIGSVERAERNISIINLEKIANALEVNIIELFKEIE